jgi:hypothetical protein
MAYPRTDNWAQRKSTHVPMALPKKKARIITVDRIQYNWLVGPNDGFNLFVAQKLGVQGQKIEVYFNTDLNAHWTELPYTSPLNLKIIKPREAAVIIQQALQLGWRPDEKGKPLVYDLLGESLIPRKAVA